MTTQISGSSIVVGSIDLTTPLSVPDGGAGTLVAFSAYQSVAQSLPNGVLTKLQFQTEEFDTTSSYDNVTNFRFQPNVAGYYHVNGGFQVITAVTYIALQLYKNGVAYKTLNVIGTPTASAGQGGCLVFLNGSSDYIELFGSQNTTAQNTTATAVATYFQAILIRAS